MNNFKKISFYTVKTVSYIIIFIGVFLLFTNFFTSFRKNCFLGLNIRGTGMGIRPVEVFWLSDAEDEYSPEKMIGEDSVSADEFFCNKNFPLPNEGVYAVRIDLGDRANASVTLKSIKYNDSRGYCITEPSEINEKMLNDLTIVSRDEESITFKTTQKKGMPSDPYIMLTISELTPHSGEIPVFAFVFSLVTVFLLNRYVKIKAIVSLARDLYVSRKLIFSLALNDFKTKYAGSYFGIIWAFVQPVCTILVFWFVFQVGFRNSNVSDVPFILWFIAGMIPWFFFSEAWNNATMALPEYSYLVKKIVFKIHILPLVKIVSCLFVHLFFIVFMFVIYLIYGIRPDVYWLQVFYYSACMILLVTALSYITSALVVFFKDIGQIMNIVLQFGMWLTPIMWDIDRIPASYMWLFKLNPMYYIVQGYRDSMIYKITFFNNIKQTMYFWIVLFVLMLIGSLLYKRLKPHFADVL